ncbi:MAG TPA: hypothetical protein VNC61_10725 [Acidimicrobiales bacterium]|nr:hypothetical protein [Acidimicrobiales bacterium]
MAPFWFGVQVSQAASAAVWRARARLVGSVDGLVETLERRRRRWSMNYGIVHERDMEALAPVVAKLAGL